MQERPVPHKGAGGCTRQPRAAAALERPTCPPCRAPAKRAAGAAAGTVGEPRSPTARLPAARSPSRSPPAPAGQRQRKGEAGRGRASRPAAAGDRQRQLGLRARPPEQQGALLPLLLLAKERLGLRHLPLDQHLRRVTNREQQAGELASHGDALALAQQLAAPFCHCSCPSAGHSPLPTPNPCSHLPDGLKEAKSSPAQHKPNSPSINPIPPPAPCSHLPDRLKEAEEDGRVEAVAQRARAHPPEEGAQPLALPHDRLGRSHNGGPLAGRHHHHRLEHVQRRGGGRGGSACRRRKMGRAAGWNGQRQGLSLLPSHLWAVHVSTARPSAPG